MYHLPERASYPACRDQRQWASVEMSSANGFTSVPFTSCATVGPSVIYFVFLRSALVLPAIPRVSVDARHISATNSGTPARKVYSRSRKHRDIGGGWRRAERMSNSVSPWQIDEILSHSTSRAQVPS